MHYHLSLNADWRWHAGSLDGRHDGRDANANQSERSRSHSKHPPAPHRPRGVRPEPLCTHKQATKPILKQGHDSSLGRDDSRHTLRRVRNMSVSWEVCMWQGEATHSFSNTLRVASVCLCCSHVGWNKFTATHFYETLLHHRCSGRGMKAKKLNLLKQHILTSSRTSETSPSHSGSNPGLHHSSCF